MAWARCITSQESCCAVAVLLALRRMPADRGGVEEDLGALHRGEPRAFGKPLIPADQHADRRDLGLPRDEAGVAGREVELFVEQRIVRDVHLAIHAQQRSVGVDHRGGVVIHAGRALLEQRRDDHGLVFLRELARMRRSTVRESSRRARRSDGPRPGRSTASETAPACRRSSRPSCRACSASASWWARFRFGSSPHAIWLKPTLTTVERVFKTSRPHDLTCPAASPTGTRCSSWSCSSSRAAAPSLRPPTAASARGAARRRG